MAAIEQDQKMLAVGTQVDVFSRYRESWVTGFEVASIRDGEYVLSRHIDSAVLPGRFRDDDVRPSGRPHG